MPLKDYAPGLPSRSDYGDLTKLKANSIYDLIVQEHKADRAGLHNDVRLGDKDTGLYSWATRKEFPKPGDRIGLFQQPLHTHSYAQFEGSIPKGSYGAGTVKKKLQGRALITKLTPKTIHMTTADRRSPERFVFAQSKEPKRWLMVNTTPNKPLPYEKVHYKSIPKEQVQKALDKLGPDDSVQAKIDGASSLVELLRNGVDIFSYRAEKGTNRPITHTERFFQGARPELKIPPKLRGSILRGETYGTKSDKVIPPQELGGILNSTIENAIKSQREKGIELRNMLFDIQQYGKKPVDFELTPYATRRRYLLEALAHLPSNKFYLAPEVKGPEAAKSLWKQIGEGKHPHTTEGVVIHKERGKPHKAKYTDEYDVHITDIFPGEGKYKGHGGGFTYSLVPGGKAIGRVGTGFSDELRKQIAKDPAAFIGRIARIRSQQQLPSGAYRAPSLLALHEDYPNS